jgi:DNA-binding beta-propeller fold protein YncE
MTSHKGSNLMFRALVAVSMGIAACLGFSSPAQATPHSLTELTGFHGTSGVAFSPDGSIAYLIQDNNGSLLDHASLIALDTRTHAQLSSRIDAGYTGAGVTHSISMAPNGLKAYVSLGSGVVRPFNTASMTFGPAITVGTGGIGQVVFTPDGSHAYVAVTNNGSGTLIKEIEVNTDSVVATLPVCGGPAALAITPNGSKLFANCGDGNVAVIDTNANTVLTMFTPAGHLQGTTISMSPDGTKVYASAFSSGTPTVTSVINTSNNSVLHQFTGEPKDVSFSEDGNTAYLMSADLGKLQPTDTSSFTVGTPIDVTTPSSGNWFLIDKNPAAEQYWITGGNYLFIVGDGPPVNTANSGSSQSGNPALASTGVSQPQFWITFGLGAVLLIIGSFLHTRFKVNK